MGFFFSLDEEKVKAFKKIITFSLKIRKSLGICFQNMSSIFNQGCIESQHNRFGREHIFFHRRSYGSILKTYFQNQCVLNQLSNVIPFDPLFWVVLIQLLQLCLSMGYREQGKLSASHCTNLLSLMLLNFGLGVPVSVWDSQI